LILKPGRCFGRVFAGFLILRSGAFAAKDDRASWFETPRKTRGSSP
jgi:hypothetical protein